MNSEALHSTPRRLAVAFAEAVGWLLDVDSKVVRSYLATSAERRADSTRELSSLYASVLAVIVIVCFGIFVETASPYLALVLNTSAFAAAVLFAVLLMIAALWRIFEKAGKPGWAAIVPIYNFMVMLKIARKPAWWLILLLIPIVNIVALLVLLAALARNFGKGPAFALGLLLLPPIFGPLLAWGDARYQPVVSGRAEL
jgi:hypothetical protein